MYLVKKRPPYDIPLLNEHPIKLWEEVKMHPRTSSSRLKVKSYAIIKALVLKKQPSEFPHLM